MDPPHLVGGRFPLPEVIMRTFLLSCLLSGSAVAQTTGVPGINDLTLNFTFGSGMTSCATTCFPNGNVVLTYTVSVGTGAIPFLMLNLCPCQPCSLTAPLNFCAPTIPATACGGSNQSLDLDVSAACPILFLPVGPTTTGVVGVSITVPPIPGPPCTNMALSAQALILDLCGAGLTVAPGPFVFSQAITTWF